MIIVNDSQFTENESKWEGGVIALQDILANRTEVVDSTFTRNYAGMSIISLSFAQLSLSNIDFKDNFADVMTHGVYLYQSELRA